MNDVFKLLYLIKEKKGFARNNGAPAKTCV